jgi:hypothetical protein
MKSKNADAAISMHSQNAMLEDNDKEYFGKTSTG